MPVYIEVEDGERLSRALQRERHLHLEDPYFRILTEEFFPE